VEETGAAPSTPGQPAAPSAGEPEGAAETDASAPFYVIDCEGEVNEVPEAAQAEQALMGVFAEALRRSIAAKAGTPARKTLETAEENNEPGIAQLAPDVQARLRDMLATARGQLEQLAAPSANRPAARAGAATAARGAQDMGIAPPTDQAHQRAPEATPAPSGEPTPPPTVVPFNGNVMVWFAPTKDEIDRMRKRDATPAEFAAFRVANQPGLTALSDERHSWYKVLDAMLAKGEAGAVP
jgi:hypothetical protein